MDRLKGILNSPFGLLIAGALISGILVQYISSRWQQRNWLFQQRFTSESTKFSKELEQKYKVLEDVNAAVATVLTHCQGVVVGYTKGVSGQQRNDEIRAYNEAVNRWEVDFRIYTIRLQTFYSDKQLSALWEGIKKERDNLDVAIYLLTTGNQGTPEGSLKLIEKVSSMTVDLSRRMFEEINRMKERGSGI